MIHFNLVIITTNHIYIGAVHIMSGLIGGSIGFGLSIILRLELALPGFILCPPLQYNCNITFHGIFMTSSMIMPILIGGFGNILLPLMLCSSDMIFPRLNALSLWLVFNSLIIMFLSMLMWNWKSNSNNINIYLSFLVLGIVMLLKIASCKTDMSYIKQILLINIFLLN